MSLPLAIHGEAGFAENRACLGAKGSGEGARIRQFDHRIAPGDDVAVGNAHNATATDRLEHARIHVVYEDDALLVLDKPSGLLTVATDRNKDRTLYVRLNEYLRNRVHPSASRCVVNFSVPPATAPPAM